MTYLKLSAIALSIGLLTGCSYFGFGSDNERTLGEEALALEIPPNLSTPKDSGLLVIPEIEITGTSKTVKDRVLQKPDNVELLRDGRNYWIRVAGDRENIWHNLLQFWSDANIKLRVKNKPHGIIETSWFSGDDKRFASDTKDKFRLRVEEADGGIKALELYITHYGTIATDIGAERPRWNNRERDHDLEVEFLHQLADYLDRVPTQVTTIKKATTNYDVSDEKLVISEDFKHAWRKVGIALEQANILISDRNRNKGIYFVNKVDFLEDLNSNRGPLDRLISPDKVKQEKPFEVHIESKGARSIISIEGKTMTPAKKLHVLKAIRDHL